MFKFENEDYKNLSEKIILSENDNWEKAIGIAILNVKLISKQIFFNQTASKKDFDAVF